MGEKIVVKEEKLDKMAIRWEIDPSTIDFALRAYLKEEPPLLVRILLETVHDFFYFNDEKTEGYEAGAFYIGDSVILTHLGCVIPATEEDIKRNLEIIEKNKEGLLKIYEGKLENEVKILKNINDNWDKIKEVEQKFLELVWGKRNEEQKS